MNRTLLLSLALPLALAAPARAVELAYVAYDVADAVAGEDLWVYEYGLDACCLRYANVYGERQNPHGEAGVVAIFLHRLLAGERATINGDGLQTRDYVHVSDVVAANLAAAGRPGYLVYNVGTGIETSVVALYRELARAAGSALEPRHGPPRPGEQRRSAIDASRARRELGLGPPLPLAEGLARTAAWFRERHAAVAR